MIFEWLWPDDDELFERAPPYTLPVVLGHLLLNGITCWSSAQESSSFLCPFAFSRPFPLPALLFQPPPDLPDLDMFKRLFCTFNATIKECAGISRVRVNKRITIDAALNITTKKMEFKLVNISPKFVNELFLF